MLKVGITGGIGSGKTTVCKIFDTLDIPVYYADERAKWLMENHEPLVQQITELFGEEAYSSDGKLNRPFIAQIVFNDKSRLEQLNQLVHPVVIEDGDKWHQKQSAPYTLKEAALLFESGSYKSLDKVITVFAPEHIRIERVMRRDGVDAETVKARMRNQMSDEQKMALADFVIHNYGDHLLVPQVLRIHGWLMSDHSSVNFVTNLR